MAVADDARDIRIDAGDARIALTAGRAEVAALEALAERLGVKPGEVLDHMTDAKDAMQGLIAIARRRPDVAILAAEVLGDLGRGDWARSFQKIADDFSESRELK